MAFAMHNSSGAPRFLDNRSVFPSRRNCAPREAFGSHIFYEKTNMATTVDSRRETVSLIGSDKVESTPVYGADDQKIGTV